jgi:hypothetical protein
MDFVYIGKCRYENQEQKVPVWYTGIYPPISSTGNNAVWTCRQIPTFQMNILRPSLVLTPNVVVEWLTLLRFQDVRGSNLGPETAYPDLKIFRGFPQSSRRMPE